MNAKKAQPELYLQLDRKRKVVFNLGAMCALEERLGKSLFRVINWKDLGFRDLTLLLWAALLTDDPDLKLEQVHELFDAESIGSNLENLQVIVAEILDRAMPEADEASASEKKRIKAMIGKAAMR